MSKSRKVKQVTTYLYGTFDSAGSIMQDSLEFDEFDRRVTSLRQNVDVVRDWIKTNQLFDVKVTQDRFDGGFTVTGKRFETDEEYNTRMSRDVKVMETRRAKLLRIIQEREESLIKLKHNYEQMIAHESIENT